MPTFTMTKSYDDGSALTEAMLDDMKSSTETFLNTTKLDADNLQDSAVTTAKIAANAVTRAKLASVGHQVSSSSGAFSSTAGSATDVTNLSVSITTTGRPVVLGLIADGSATAQVSTTNSTNDNGSSAIFEWVRGSTSLGNVQVSSGDAQSKSHTYGTGVLTYLDAPAAGTYTYKLRVTAGSSSSVSVSNVKMYAYEL